MNKPNIVEVGQLWEYICPHTGKSCVHKILEIGTSATGKPAARTDHCDSWPYTYAPIDEFCLSMWRYCGSIIVKQVVKSSGETCKKCRNFSPMSEANQADGSFICYGCRT